MLSSWPQKLSLEGINTHCEYPDTLGKNMTFLRAHLFLLLLGVAQQAVASPARAAVGDIHFEARTVPPSPSATTRTVKPPTSSELCVLCPVCPAPPQCAPCHPKLPVCPPCPSYPPCTCTTTWCAIPTRPVTSPAESAGAPVITPAP